MKISIGRGFTIVELVIVVSVIGILTAFVTAGFTSVQKDARDAQVKSGAQRIAEAIGLWNLETRRTEPKYSGMGYGSAGSPSYFGDGASECSDTSGNGTGWIASGRYDCTIEDVLVHFGYLEPGYISSQPPNSKYNSPGYTYMLYGCNAINHHYVLYYSLEQPTDNDVAGYDSIAVSKCSNGQTHRDSYNMQGAILINLTPV